MPFIYEFPRPMVTVDVVVFAAPVDDGIVRVLLIRRGRDPFANRWALPGGFLDLDEELEDAARRELLEETGLRRRRLLQLGTYGAVGRDPRGRTVSAVYLAGCDFGHARIVAGDDAAAAAWHPAARPPRLAFDHGAVLRDARARLTEVAIRPAAAFARALFGTTVSAASEALRRAAQAGNRRAPR